MNEERIVYWLQFIAGAVVGIAFTLGMALARFWNV